MSGLQLLSYCTLLIAECVILKRYILRNFTYGKFLQHKVYFAELKLQVVNKLIIKRVAIMQ